MRDLLSYEGFKNGLNVEFLFNELDNPVIFTLFEISEKKETAETVSFSIYFKCPDEYKLGQESYILKNESVGEGALFLVPIEEKNGNRVFEPIFSRFING